MPTNQFLPFATGLGAYVLNNAAYTALAARSSGYPTGLLLKEDLNSAIRQGTFVAAALSGWVTTYGALDTLDDGVLANWRAAFDDAFVKRNAALLNGTFKVYAGNPNGNVAGAQGVVGTTFPSVVWDITNNIWWVCTTTGNAAAAVWVIVGDQPAWPFWCGTSAGTANVPVLTTPPGMVEFISGTAVAWKIGVAPNTGAVTVTVGAFGTWPLYKDGPAGPVPLVGGELDLNNLCSARFDGAILHLIATELGTAALADATSNTGKVVAFSGPAAVGNIPKFSDTFGTMIDGGPPGVALAPQYIDQTWNGLLLATGVYLADTSVAAFTVLLPAVPVKGNCLEFIDAAGTWLGNNLTLNNNGSTIMGSAENLILNVSGEVFRIWYNGTDWRLI